MVFEYAECTLREHLHTHFVKLRWADKYKLGLDVAKGLHHLHERDILHRDLVCCISKCERLAKVITPPSCTLFKCWILTQLLLIVITEYPYPKRSRQDY